MFQTLWSRRMGRVAFAVNFAVIAALIFVLPGVIRLLLGVLLTSSYKMSPYNPATGIVATLLFVPITLFALLSLFAWLLFAARARLRAIGLSGAFLLLFPLLAFQPLWGAIFGQLGALMLLPSPASPLLHPEVLLSLLLGAGLAIGPTDPMWSSSNTWRVIQRWTDCDGAISRETFIRRTTPVLAAFLLLYFAPALWVSFSHSGLSATEPPLVGGAAALHQWRNAGTAVATYASPSATLGLPLLLNATGILRALLSVLLLSLTVRRLHGLGRTGFAALFFPLPFSSAASIGMAFSTVALMTPFLTPALKLMLAPVALRGLTIVTVPTLVINVLAMAVLIYLYAGADKAIAGAPASANRFDQRPSWLQDPFMWATCAGAIVLFVAAAVVVHIENSPHTLRYRLTLSVNTPDGVKTGSNVVQMRAPGVAINETPELLGQATVVDLGAGQPLLVALMTKVLRTSQQGHDFAWGEIGPHLNLFKPCFRSSSPPNRLTPGMEMDDAASCRQAIALTPADMPDVVAFDDPSKPSTIKLIDPTNLAATFGPDVTWNAITLTPTTDPVSYDLDERLPWIKGTSFGQLRLDIFDRAEKFHNFVDKRDFYRDASTRQFHYSASGFVFN